MLAYVTLVLGLASWAVAVACLVARPSRRVTSWLVAASLALCCLALLAVLAYNHLESLEGDYSAVFDTAYGWLIGGAALLVVALPLNVASLARARD